MGVCYVGCGVSLLTILNSRGTYDFYPKSHLSREHPLLSSMDTVLQVAGTMGRCQAKI